MVPLFIILLISLFMFLPLLYGELIFVGDFSGSDLLDIHLPFKYLLRDSYRKGELPLWEQRLANGFPLFAEGQIGALYPLNLLLFFLSPEIVLNIFVISAFVVGGVGFYLYLRSLPGLSAYASFVGAISFMFSSFFVARIKHLNIITVGAFLPISLYFARKYAQERCYRWLLLLIVVFTLQIFAGHAQMAYICIFIALWHLAGELLLRRIDALARYLQTRSLPKNVIRNVLRFIAPVVFVATSTIALAAVQLLPTYELVAHSMRRDWSLQQVYANPMHPKFLLTLFYPYIFGNPADATYKVGGVSNGIWWENVLYVGLLPVVLVLLMVWFWLIRIRAVGVASYFRSNANSEEFLYKLFLLVSFLFFLGVTFGSYSVVFLLTYYLVPGMSSFRFLQRFNIYIILYLCVLFAYAVVYFKRWFSVWLVKLLLVLLLFLDIWLYSNAYISYIPIDEFRSRINNNIVAEFVVPDGSYRILPATQYFEHPFSRLGWKAEGREAVLNRYESLPNNHLSSLGFNSFTERSLVEGALQVRERYILEEALFSDLKYSLPGFENILDLWNVRYVVTFSDLSSDRYSLIGERKYETERQGLKLYESRGYMPRAFLVHQAQPVPNESLVLDRLVYPRGSFYQQFYYVDNGHSYFLELPQAEASQEKLGDVKILSSSQKSVEMVVDAWGDGFVVFSDTYYPGWRAYVDGDEVPVFTANLIQRAIAITEGRHVVKWEYVPVSFYLGLLVSIIMGVVLVASLFVPKFNRLLR